MQRIKPPEIAKISRYGLSIARYKNSCYYQAGQCGNLGDGKQVLDGRAQLEPKNIQYAQKYYNHNAAEVLRVEAHIHVSQHHRANLDRGNLGNMEYPLLSGDAGEKVS